FIQRSIDLREQRGDTAGLILGYNDLAITHAYQNKLPYSLDLFQKSLEMAEALDDLRNQAYAVNNIGSVYDMIQQDEEAMEYYKRALDLKQKINDRYGVASGYFNIAALLADQGDWKSARGYYSKALRMFEEMGNQSRIMNCYYNLGRAMLEQEQFDSSRVYLEEALLLNKKMKNKRAFTQTLTALSSLNAQTGNIRLAREQIEQARALYADTDDFAVLEDVYEEASFVYEELGMYKEALAAYKLYKSSSDSSFNAGQVEEITQLKNEYAFKQEKKILETERKGREAVLEEKLRRERLVQQFSLAALFLTGIGLFFSIRNYQQRGKINKALAEKNDEIAIKNKEIQAQRDDVIAKNALLHQRQEEIVAQRDEIASQRDQLEQQQIDITASLSYAHRLQSRLMPSYKELLKPYQDGFVMLRPRDGVSGDFYWGGSHTCVNTGESVYWLAAVDCTGHGVPGAFLSIIGLQQLDRILESMTCAYPDEVLEMLDQSVRELLSSDGKAIQDGMDMSLCIIRPQSGYMTFSGARNGLIVVQDGDMTYFSGTRRSIGEKQYRKQVLDFERHRIELTEDTKLYLYSDGMPDQFGGPSKRKFTLRRLKTLITENAHLSFEEQQMQLEKALDEWQFQGQEQQIDDILVMGVKV
ncbi:MAG: tetratricopeptide repeat protein, partial [Bacteroidota bacterium]